MSKYAALPKFWLWIALGWLTTPGCWLVFWTPFSLMHLLTASAAQESGYNPKALNDKEPNGKPSGGMVQFNQPTWETLSGESFSANGWQDPGNSGYYAVKYIWAGLQTSWRWWFLLSIPYVRFAAMRRMWRYGIGQSAAESFQWMTDGEDESSLSTNEVGGHAWPGYWMWIAPFTAAAILIGAPVLAALTGAVILRKRGGK